MYEETNFQRSDFIVPLDGSAKSITRFHSATKAQAEPERYGEGRPQQENMN